MTRTSRTANPALRFGLAAGLAIVLGAAVVGCSSTGGEKNAEPATTTVAADKFGGNATDGNGAVVNSLPAPQPQQVVVSGGQSTGNNGNNNSGGGQPPAPSAPKPVITSFSTPENIDCHNGMFQNFTASWSTQHATKVTISIDGPGVYNTYGPSGDASLPFNCSSSHSFLLTAYGAGGHTVTKSITLQPRNVQMPSGDEDEDI
jgi:hypothetical protein